MQLRPAGGAKGASLPKSMGKQSRGFEEDNAASVVTKSL
jgi:hypothetical protein